MRDIVVVGCGLAGYHAALHLENKIAGRRRVRLTVVNRRAHFVFTPLLCAVATGELEPGHVTAGLDRLFDASTRVVIDDVDTIDVDDKTLWLGDGDSMSFDYLVVATGSSPADDVFDGADSLTGPDSLESAVEIRERLDANANCGESSNRYIVVGGSTTGVEWAGQLASRLQRREKPTGDTPVVELYETQHRLLPDHSAHLADHVTADLEQLGVRVKTDTRIERADATSVTLEDGTARSAAMVFHCAGQHGCFPDTPGVCVDETGRIVVDSDLGISAYTGIFAAGDVIRGPKTEVSNTNPQIAKQQGRWAARNLVATMSGRSLKPFEYDDRGDFIAMGPDNTVLQMGAMQLEGKAAWLAHRLYYTALMPRTIQKLRLLRDWVGQPLADEGSRRLQHRLPDDS